MSDNPVFASEPPLSWKIKNKLTTLRWRIEGLLVDACLAIIRWLERDSNYIKHAKREFAILYKDLPPEQMDGPNMWIRDNIIDLLAVLGTQGHSGGSIGYCLRQFDNLAHFRCIKPLTGADDEWNEVGDGVWQNNRMSSIFKGEDGRAYTIDGYIFEEPNGIRFTGHGSRKYIEFPYHYENPVYIKVGEDGLPLRHSDRVLTGRGL